MTYVLILSLCIHHTLQHAHSDLKAEGENPVARIISSLNLKNHAMTILLSNTMRFIDMTPAELKAAGDEETPFPVNLDIRMSSFQNANARYSKKKVSFYVDDVRMCA
jgi:hypothetical protein